MRGNIIETFPSVTKAAESIGITQQCFSYILEKINSPYYKYTFDGMVIDIPIKYKILANYYNYNWSVCCGTLTEIKDDKLHNLIE